jgi:hypothetical protein
MGKGFYFGHGNGQGHGQGNLLRAGGIPFFITSFKTLAKINVKHY